MSTQISKHTSVEETGSIIMVTPEIATKWLEHNTQNRKINQAVVDRYASDMKENRWKLTHQGIAFDDRGTLIDGQHRLWAIVLSGKAAPMRVFFNMPTDTMHCVDVGKVRSNLDVMKLTGNCEGLGNVHLAILRAMLNCRILKHHGRSVSSEIQLYERHKEAIEFAVKHFYSRKIAKITNSLVGAVIARAYYSCSHEKLIRFCEVMQSGIANDPTETSAVLLARYLLRESGNTKTDRQAKYGKIQRAVWAFVHDESITKLCEFKSEMFPIPEELEIK